MEKFNDQFGDLSGYKILSFEEVSKGFEGNKNPLQSISINSFEDRSNEYSLKSPFGENSLFYKKQINKIIYTVDSVPLWRYRVENSTKGTELISNYTRYDETIDPSKGKYDEETDFIIYIEEQNSVNGYIIDINTVCLIKMSQAMINEYNETIKRNADSTILEDWSNIIIQEQKEKNNITFTKEKLLEAFKLEIAYRPLKKISVGDKKYTSVELTNAFLDGISSAFRTLKFEEESWDYSLKSENYLFENPEKAIVFIQNRISTSVGLLQKLEGYFYALEHIFSFDKTLLKTFRILISLLKSNLLLIGSLIEVTKEFSRHYFAFICGIWDGIIEFIAGFIDIILLMFKFYFHAEELNEEDEITYLKLKETIEEFTENYIKDPDFISKAIGEAIVKYAEVRYSENQNGYKISHNIGEDLIIVLDIIFSIVEVVKSFADAGKILPKLERWIDNALERNPTLERKLEDIRKPKELSEEPIRERQLEEVVVEPKKKITSKERIEARKQKIAKKLQEQKVLRTKTIDGAPSPSYEKGFDYYDARTPKPSEIPIHLRRQARLLTHKVDKEVMLLLNPEHTSGFSKGKKLLKTKKGKKYVQEKWLRDRQLIAGMIHQDRKLGEIIKVKTNFPKSEMKKFLMIKNWERGKVDLKGIKEIYKYFKQKGYLEYDMHSHIEQLLRIHFDEVAKGIKHPASYDWERTGGLPGTHAEILALNDLLWTLESKGVKIDKKVLKGFTGYNKNLLDKEYMIRCGDCQLILKDVLFLEKITKFK